MDDDNEFAELEAELRTLAPMAPPPEVELALAAELGRPVLVAARAPKPVYRTATTWTSWKWANWGVAAALVGLMAWFSWQHPAPDAAARPVPVIDPMALTVDGLATTGEFDPAATLERGGVVYRPVSAERIVLGSRVDAVVQLADGSAAERVRDYFIDSVTWRASTGEAELQVNVPREAVRFVGLAVN